MDFVGLEDQKVNVKEGEKLNKYLDLARELKNLCILKATLIPIVIAVPWNSPQESG